MTKERKILLNYLLRQYKQSLKQSVKTGDFVQIDVKSLKYIFNKNGMYQIQKLINQYGNKWKVKNVIPYNASDYGADSVMLDDMPSGKSTWVHIVNVKNEKILESVPQQVLKEYKQSLRQEDIEALRANVVKRLVSGGYNKAQAFQKFDKHYEYIKRVYGNKGSFTPTKIASLISALWDK